MIGYALYGEFMVELKGAKLAHEERTKEGFIALNLEACRKICAQNTIRID